MHLVSGGYDHLLKFITHGVQEYQDIIERLLGLQVGIEKYFSYIVIKTVFAKPFIPVSTYSV